MENKKTEIDIILPNYNSYKFVDETIQSVLKQNFYNWKLIIIDDCSNIETRKKLKKYEKSKKIKIYWLKKNKDEQDAFILYQKGYNFHSIKDYKNAIKKYKESLRFNPINKSVYYNLALCYHNLNKWEKAKPFYKDAANLGHESSIKFLREYYFNNGLEFPDEHIRKFGWN